MPSKRIIFLLGLLCTFVAGYSRSENVQSIAPEEQFATEYLLMAVRQASKPARNMRVKWTYETVAPVPAYPLMSGWKPPKQPPHTFAEYTATVRGICSRIESLNKTYETSASKEPYDVRFSTAVFDGTRQRRLTDRIKGQSTTPLGWQYLRDKNSALLTQELFGWPFDLNNERLIQDYSFRLLDSEKPGIYLLEIIKDNGSIHHWTIDGNRGFNVIKIERFRSPGDKDYEVNFKLKQYKDDLWYIAERERIRYPSPGREGKPRVEYRLLITEADFGIEVSDETFKLEFPHGTKVWDGTLKDWFVAGYPVPAVIEQESLDVSSQKKSAKCEEEIEIPKQQELRVETPELNASRVETKQEKTLKVSLTTTPKLWYLLAVPLIVLVLIVLHAIKTKKE